MQNTSSHRVDLNPNSKPFTDPKPSLWFNAPIGFKIDIASPCNIEGRPTFKITQILSKYNGIYATLASTEQQPFPPVMKPRNWCCLPNTNNYILWLGSLSPLRWLLRCRCWCWCSLLRSRDCCWCWCLCFLCSSTLNVIPVVVIP